LTRFVTPTPFVTLASHRGMYRVRAMDVNTTLKFSNREVAQVQS